MNEMEMRVESRTELDSHANMPVVGKHAYIMAETGKKVDVLPFTPDYKLLTVPLVDATVKYDNPYDGKTYILVLHNALHVPSMDHNLIPPFMLREMGVTVNDVLKIHKEDPTVDDHAITFAETDLEYHCHYGASFHISLHLSQRMMICSIRMRSTSYHQLLGTRTQTHIQRMRSLCWIGKETCNLRKIANIGLS